MSTSKCTQKLSRWQEGAWDLIKAIPPGFVTTYKEVAKELGYPELARSIGNVLAKNDKLVIIPCHRVVKSDGSLGGYVRGATKKKELLQQEGVEFSTDNKVNLKKCFWSFDSRGD